MARIIPEMTEKDKARFWKKISKTDGNECWVWTGNSLKDGYGMFSLKNSGFLAHRVSWTIANGKIADPSLFVLHECDNPKCVNPDHLFLGTHQDNMDDMIAKGRKRVATGDASGARTHPEKLKRGDENGSRKYPERLVRGDDHWTRKQPEKLATGDRNGSRKHPEKRPRGDDHFARKNPELLAHGDRNGARTHPEKLARGDDHWTHKNPDLVTKGEACVRAKLTEAKVIEIRQLSASGIGYAELGKMFNVTGVNIKFVVLRKSWKHVP